MDIDPDAPTQMPPGTEAYYLAIEQTTRIEAEAVAHLGSTSAHGRAREQLVTAMLERTLPGRIEVERGEVVMSVPPHLRSGESDLVLVDSMGSAVRRIGGETVVPVEAAIAVVEVKSNLTAENLKKALGQVARVKALRRSRQPLIFKDGRGDERVPIPPDRPAGIIVGLRGWDIDRLGRVIVDEFAQSSAPSEEFFASGPDLVVVLGGGFLYKNDRHLLRCEPGDEAKELISLKTRSGLMAIVQYVEEHLHRYGMAF